MDNFHFIHSSTRSLFFFSSHLLICGAFFTRFWVVKHLLNWIMKWQKKEERRNKDNKRLHFMIISQRPHCNFFLANWSFKNYVTHYREDCRNLRFFTISRYIIYDRFPPLNKKTNARNSIFRNKTIFFLLL